MTDHLFSFTLTFALLAGGTVAIGSELFGAHGKTPAPVAVAEVTLPMVVITGRRSASAVVALQTQRGTQRHAE